MGRDNIAIDAHGHMLPYKSDEVENIVRKALDTGKIIAAIVEMPTGDVAVQIIGDPSPKLADILEQVARSYRVAIRGH